MLQSTAPTQLIPLQPLTGQAFRDFGEVIENPSTHTETLRFTTVAANQGSATKVLDVSHLLNHYALAASQKPGRPVMNMFVCKPRQLPQNQAGQSVFPVKILERHPFTPQTFVPTGLDKDDESTAYIVVVAPTLPLNPSARAALRESPYPSAPPRRKRSLKDRLLGSRPNPFTNDYVPSTTPAAVTVDPSPSVRPKGPGLPDLSRVRAFVARGDQSVTYAPGTWHAPMIVLGRKAVEFVVVQFANGVGVEDCQEVEVLAGEGEEGLGVVVEDAELLASDGSNLERAKL